MFARRQLIVGAAASIGTAVLYPRPAAAFEWHKVPPAEAGFVPDIASRLDKLIAEKRAWGLHGVTNLLPSTVLHGARPPRGLAAAYRALCRLDAKLTTTAPALAFANSLALLAIRAQPSA